MLSRWKETWLKFSTKHEDFFPTLLKELVEKIEENKTQNIISIFCKSKMFPPTREFNAHIYLHMVGMTFSDEKSVEYLGIHELKQRRRKQQFPAGKTKSASDLDTTSDMSGDSKALPVGNIRKQVYFSSCSDNSSTIVQLESDEESETFSGLVQDQPIAQTLIQNRRLIIRIWRFANLCYCYLNILEKLLVFLKKEPHQIISRKETNFGDSPMRKALFFTTGKNLL